MPTRQGSSKATEAAGSASRPKASSTKKVVMRKMTQRKSKWNAENILSDPKSPLAKADLRSILANPFAWDALDKDEQRSVLALFPDHQHIVAADADARPDFVSLMNDDSFRYDCAAYVEHIRAGRHDREWLASAWAANERRRAGDFDEYLETKFREDWEVELPLEMRSRRDVTAKALEPASSSPSPSSEERQKDTAEVPKAHEDEVKKQNAQIEVQVEVQREESQKHDTGAEDNCQGAKWSDDGEVVEQCIVVQPMKMDVDEDGKEDKA